MSSDLGQEAILATATHPRPGSHGRPIPDDTATIARQLGPPDVDAGWPPSALGAEVVRTIEASQAVEEDAWRVRQEAAALAGRHQEVVELLVGRSEILGSHLVARRDVPADVPGQARVSFANYTTNEVVEVETQNGQVSSVARKEPWEHPASNAEMTRAIAMARADPSLNELVQDFEAHAILQVSVVNPDASHYRHRCIHVMFTEADDPHRERPVLGYALVDLNLEQVVASGPGSCVDCE